MITPDESLIGTIALIRIAVLVGFIVYALFEKDTRKLLFILALALLFPNVLAFVLNLFGP